VPLAQLGEGGGHQDRARGGECADRDPVLRGSHCRGRGGLGRPKFTEHAFALPDEDRADVGEPDSGPAALDQPGPDLRLELAQFNR
jgi:hypothetical protein